MATYRGWLIVRGKDWRLDSEDLTVYLAQYSSPCESISFLTFILFIWEVGFTKHTQRVAVRSKLNNRMKVSNPVHNT